ncbi:unnamed protein product [Clonostachys solani]|uniref:Uncharacterized protein n=1 Tax=Clonostachys solani TaxID=160281 RepID=A0A9N9ZLH2_9HYPO|nr:unnamed protein product [Clonostachys solani]
MLTWLGSQFCLRKNGAKAGSGSHVLSIGIARGRRDILAVEVGEEASISARKLARASVAVDLAGVAEVGGAGRVGGAVGAGEHLAGTSRLDGSDDVLEHVALGDNHGARVDLERVAVVVVPVVVDGVEEGVATDLGAAAGGVVDVVVLEGDQLGGRRTYIGRASKVDSPVVVGVAVGRPAGLSVNLAVGNGHTVAGAGAEHNVLTANQRGGDMIDPDQISVVDGDGITAPDQAGVEVRDVDVLDDDVLRAAHNLQALALYDTRATDTHKRLVAANRDCAHSGLVIGDADLGGVGLVVVAPAVLVDGLLARRSRSVRSTPCRRDRTLGSGEVKGLGQEDHAGRAVTEVRDQLGRGRGRDGARTASAGDSLGETLSRAGDASGGA